jgi:outer membrane protein assembly factor BamD (BamD/ComL family)
MSFRLLTFVTLACLASLTGCKKKSEAQLAEEQRAALRDTKRAEAAEAYKTLGEKFPDHPKAKEAAGKAAALATPAKK